MNFAGCCWGLLWYIAMSIVLLVILLFCFVYWPGNLYHSKSLPYLSENFVGREQKIEEIMQFIDFGNSTVRIVNIIGSPGFGKSTLAMHVGHAVVKRGDVVHYVNMADFPEKDVKLILSEKVMDSARVIAKHIDFGTLLRWARERYYNNLLILDNCDKVIHSQKQEFDDAVNKLVEESIYIKVIFTSRKHEPFPKYDRWVKIDELSEAHAHELLESKLLSRVSITHEEMQQIANHTGNVPLALHIIGSLLCLPFSPTPSRVIQELQTNPMKILTPEDFHASEQMFTTIHLSYTYLSNETKKIGRQLTVFPGSFKLDAATAIICTRDNGSDCNKVLNELVKSSLLEYDQRNGRYQYHQLIRKYFLHVQSTNHSDEDEQLIPAFHIYYANLLITLSNEFGHQYEKSLGKLDSERHNIQHLFEVKQSLPIKEFVVTVISLSKGIEVGLLSLRFSKSELCTSLSTYLNCFDDEVRSLDNHLQNGAHISVHSNSLRYGQTISFNKKTILTHYMVLIDQVAKCKNDSDGIEAAKLVYHIRRAIVEQRSMDIELQTFTTFFTILSQYYAQIGLDIAVIECHRLMIMRTDSHLATCERSSWCDYYDIGIAYYKMHQYHKAAEFLEKALSLTYTYNRMKRFEILIHLINSYDKLDKRDEVKSTSYQLDALVSIIKCCIDSKDIFSYSVAVQHTIDFYRREGLIKEVISLEDKLLNSVEEAGLKVVSTSQSFELDNPKKPVPVNIIYNVLNRIYEAKQYSRAVEKGIHFIAIFNKTSDLAKAVVQFRILVGKAMFDGRDYSIGMDQMELALNEILKSNDLYEQLQAEKAIACWYLIPRIKYIYHCYPVSISEVPVTMGWYILSVLFLSGPFPNVCFFESLRLNLATILSSYYASGSTRHAPNPRELVIHTPDIGTLTKMYYHDAITSMTNDYYTLVNKSIVKLFTMLRNHSIAIYRFLFTPIWVIIVWMKLIDFLPWQRCYEEPKRSILVLPLYDVFYCFCLPYSFCFAALRYSELRYNLRALLQCLRDPRFIYGVEMSPLVPFHFASKLTVDIPRLFNLMCWVAVFIIILMKFNILIQSDPTCPTYYILTVQWQTAVMLLAIHSIL